MKLEVACLLPGIYQIARSHVLRTGQTGIGQFFDRHRVTVKAGRPTPKFIGEAIVRVPEFGSVPDIEIPLKERAE